MYQKSLHSTFGRGMHILSSGQGLKPVFRATITEEVRDSMQQESYLPFSWGHTQAGNKNMRAQYMAVNNTVKECDIEIIIHTF